MSTEPTAAPALVDANPDPAWLERKSAWLRSMADDPRLFGHTDPAFGEQLADALYAGHEAFEMLAAAPPAPSPVVPDDGANVVVRLNVVRPDREYLPERLGRLLQAWCPYIGWTRVVSVDVLRDEHPIAPGHLPDALATLPPALDPHGAPPSPVVLTEGERGQTDSPQAFVSLVAALWTSGEIREHIPDATPEVGGAGLLDRLIARARLLVAAPALPVGESGEERAGLLRGDTVRCARCGSDRMAWGAGAGQVRRRFCIECGWSPSKSAPPPLEPDARERVARWLWERQEDTRLHPWPPSNAEDRREIDTEASALLGALADSPEQVSWELAHIPTWEESEWAEGPAPSIDDLIQRARVFAALRTPQQPESGETDRPSLSRRGLTSLVADFATRRREAGSRPVIIPADMALAIEDELVARAAALRASPGCGLNARERQQVERGAGYYLCFLACNLVDAGNAPPQLVDAVQRFREAARREEDAIGDVLGDEEAGEDEDSARCTCEWMSPDDGSIGLLYPHVTDPHCVVHGGASAAGAEYERVYGIVNAPAPDGCGLTHPGGSERRTCGCRGPETCRAVAGSEGSGDGARFREVNGA